MRYASTWPRRIPRAITGVPVLLAVLVGTVYVATLLPGTGFAPGCDYFDTAKFQFIGKIWGIPHPTGYPLYIMLTHFFGLLFPWGSLAWKINLLSALFGVLTVLVLFQTMRLLAVRRDVAFMVCLAFTFTPTMWGQSTLAEVYTLHALFVVVTIYTFVRWSQDGQLVFFYCAAAVYGLSFAHHLTTVTLLPAVLFLTMATDRKALIDPKRILWLAIVILLSAATYTYLFWRSQDPNLLYYEHLIYSLRDWWDYVSGGGFRSFMFAFGIWELLSVRIPLLTRSFLNQFPVLASVVIGVAILHLRNWRINVFLLLAFLANALFALNYAIIDLQAFLLPNYLIAAVYASLSVSAWLEYLHTRYQRSTWLPLCALLLVPFLLFCLNYPGIAHRNRGSERAEEQVLSNLEAVQDHAVVFTLDEHYTANMDYLYFLHGENWIKKDIYLSQGTPHTIWQYLHQVSKPLLLRSKVEVPLGLDAYCLANAADYLTSDLYNLIPLSDTLYRIEAKQ